METKEKKATEKKYWPEGVARIEAVREYLGPQPLAQLWVFSRKLRNDQKAWHPKLRRVLSGKVFPGDITEVMFLEGLKKKWVKAND